MNLLHLTKSALTFLSVALLLSSCGKSTDVKLTIDVTSAEKSTIYLSKLSFGKSVLVDSIKIAQGNNIEKFRLPQELEPTFYTITVKDKGTITILTGQSENILLTFDTKKMIDYTIEGSNNSKKVQYLSVEFVKTKQRLEELKQEYSQTTDVTIKNSLQTEMQELLDSQKDFSTKFIWENPMSKASVMAIYQKYDESLYVFGTSDDMLLIKTVASAMNALYPESDYSKGMLQDIKRLEKLISNAKIKQLISDSETNIPDLEIEDRYGKKIKLSSLKGKVVLIDFWHSQNIKSLMENREFISIYNQFKSKGFEIFQISLDSEREKWIEALDTHKLPWINVCECSENSYAATIFNVQQIPSNYLIDRSQNIIGKNLYGNKLIDLLKKSL